MKTLLQLFIAATIFFSNSLYAQITRHTGIVVDELQSLADGTFLLISSSPAGVCTNGFKFARVNQAGVTTIDAIDKMFAQVLAAQFSGREIVLYLDEGNVNGQGICFISRVGTN